jgi:hypothetical protein
MTWIKERDALIAQTKAFVQSVSLRTEAASWRDPGPHRAGPAKPDVRPDVEPAPVAVEPVAAEPMKTLEIPPLPRILPLARPVDQVDMQTEIRARVASFRAHQERFNRERHEYFKATLARLRASIDALDHPPPRAQK